MSSTSNNPGGQPRDTTPSAFGSGTDGGTSDSRETNRSSSSSGSGPGGTTGSSSESLRQEARHLAEEAKEQGRARAGEARDAAADNLDKLADGARAAASELEDDDAAMLSHYVAEAAERLGEISGSLREKSVDELMGELTRFAREQPAMFLSGSVAIGFGLARFARATSARRSAAGSKQDELPGAPRRSGSRSPQAESSRAGTSAGSLIPGAGGYPGAGRPPSAQPGASPATSATPGAASHTPGDLSR